MFFIWSAGVRGTPLLQVLARGSPLAPYERDTLVPLLATFCATLTAVLSTLHDAEFLGQSGKVFFSFILWYWQYHIHLKIIPRAEIQFSLKRAGQYLRNSMPYASKTWAAANYMKMEQYWDITIMWVGCVMLMWGMACHVNGILRIKSICEIPN